MPELTSTEQIQRLVRGIPNSIGSYAPMLAEIEQVLADPQCNLLNVGEVVGKDPDLTARLLRLGNSSFYGFPSRLETVHEAISLIGVQQVQDLIVASSVIESFSGISAKFVNMASFWRHSLSCGIGARLLAIAKRVPKPDKLFVAGLLHDVGRLALLSQAPSLAEQVFHVYHGKRMLLREAERQVLGFDHADVAEALLRHWDYPVNLVQAVACHHHPLRAGAFALEASLVHVADFLVNAMRMGTSGEQFVPPFENKAWDQLNLGDDTLESVVDAIDSQIEAVQEVFLSRRGRRSGE